MTVACERSRHTLRSTLWLSSQENSSRWMLLIGEMLAIVGKPVLLRCKSRSLPSTLCLTEDKCCRRWIKTVSRGGSLRAGQISRVLGMQPPKSEERECSQVFYDCSDSPSHDLFKTTHQASSFKPTPTLRSARTEHTLKSPTARASQLARWPKRSILRTIRYGHDSSILCHRHPNSSDPSF